MFYFFLKVFFGDVFFIQVNSHSLRAIWHYDSNESQLLMIRDIAPYYIVFVFYFMITIFFIMLMNHILLKKTQRNSSCLIPNGFWNILAITFLLMSLLFPITLLLIDWIPELFPYFDIKPILRGLDPPFHYFDQSIDYEI